MKLTLNLNPNAMMRLHRMLDDAAMEAADRVERYYEYKDSDDEWKCKQYKEYEKLDVEINDILTALYDALDKAETVNN